MTNGCVSDCNSNVHSLLYDLLVDLVAQLHAVLEVLVVVGVGTSCLDILVDSIDLGLVGDETFLDVVESTVYFGLVELVLLSVVFHAVVCNLLSKAVLVLKYHLLDNNQSFLLVLEFFGNLIGLGELVSNIVLHLVNAIGDLAELVLDTGLEVLDLLEI